MSFCGTYGCSNPSLSSHRWVLGKWMSKNPNFKSNDDGDEEEDDDDDVDDDDDDGDDDETLRRGCCVKRLTRHMARVPFEGGEGGSLSPGCSRIRGPTRPFASQSKTQGSPLGGYLSWWWIRIRSSNLIHKHGPQQTFQNTQWKYTIVHHM